MHHFEKSVARCCTGARRPCRHPTKRNETPSDSRRRAVQHSAKNVARCCTVPPRPRKPYRSRNGPFSREHAANPGSAPCGKQSEGRITTAPRTEARREGTEWVRTVKYRGLQPQ